MTLANGNQDARKTTKITLPKFMTLNKRDPKCRSDNQQCNYRATFHKTPTDNFKVYASETKKTNP